MIGKQEKANIVIYIIYNIIYVTHTVTYYTVLCDPKYTLCTCEKSVYLDSNHFEYTTDLGTHAPVLTYTDSAPVYIPLIAPTRQKR